jgi:hypothetical protein
LQAAAVAQLVEQFTHDHKFEALNPAISESNQWWHRENKTEISVWLFWPVALPQLVKPFTHDR